MTSDNNGDAKWVWDDRDEYGRHYLCSSCKSGIFVAKELGKWVPEKCPSCGAKMDKEDA